MLGLIIIITAGLLSKTWKQIIIFSVIYGCAATAFRAIVANSNRELLGLRTYDAADILVNIPINIILALALSSVIYAIKLAIAKRKLSKEIQETNHG